MCNISPDLADYSIIIYKPFAFVIFAVGQMYIEHWTNGRFSMMNFYQPRIRQSDRWGLLGNNNYLKLNSPKDYVKQVKLSAVCIFVRIPWICSNSSLSVFYSDLLSLVVRCSILYSYQQTKRNLKLLQFNIGSNQVRFWTWFFQAYDHHHNTIL